MFLSLYLNINDVLFSNDLLAKRLSSFVSIVTVAFSEVFGATVIKIFPEKILHPERGKNQNSFAL